MVFEYRLALILQDIKSTRLYWAIFDCYIIDLASNTVSVYVTCISICIIKCANCLNGGRVQWIAKGGKNEKKKKLRSVTSTGRHSLVACEFIKSRLINYAHPTSSSYFPVLSRPICDPPFETANIHPAANRLCDDPVNTRCI